MTCRELITRCVHPERFRLLGVDLLPLTIGHIATLEGMGVIDALDPADLALCALVCSDSHRKAERKLRSRFFSLRSWFWGKIIGRWDFAEKRQLWADYLRYNTELPHSFATAPPKDGAPEIPIPAHQIVRVVLLSRLNYLPDTVDDTPFLQAQWDRITLAVLDGRITVLDKTDEDIDTEMAAIDWGKVEEVGRKILERQ